MVARVFPPGVVAVGQARGAFCGVDRSRLGDPRAAILDGGAGLPHRQSARGRRGFGSAPNTAHEMTDTPVKHVRLSKGGLAKHGPQFCMLAKCQHTFSHLFRRLLPLKFFIMPSLPYKVQLFENTTFISTYVLIYITFLYTCQHYCTNDS